MYKLIALLAILGLPTPSQAGDCFTHPVVIHEMVVSSCEILSIENAGRISQVATPATIASRYHGAILSGKEIRSRRIEVDHPSMPNPTTKKWEKINKPATFLFVSEDPEVCSHFPKGNKAMVVYYTNCECDTGAHPDGYCALTVDQVHAVPAKYKQYAQ